MGEGLFGAALVVCLLTQKYDKSINCKRECEVAACMIEDSYDQLWLTLFLAKNIKIIPMMCEKFERSGWLTLAIPPSVLWYVATAVL